MAARRAMDVLWFLLAAALGGTVGYLFAEHGSGHNETFAAYLGILVAASAVFGLVRPRWAWRWGLAVTLHQTVYVFTHPTEGGGFLIVAWLQMLLPFAAINGAVAELSAAIVRRVSRKRYRSALAPLGEELGLQLSKKDELPLSGIEEAFSLFDEVESCSTHVRNVLHGQIGEMEVAIYEHYCEPEGGIPESAGFQGSSGGSPFAYRERQVVWLRSPTLRLPRLVVRRATLWHRVGLVIEGLEMPASAAFNQRYLVLGGDVEEIRRVLTRRVLDFFAARRNIGLEADGRQIIYYRTLVVAETPRLREILDEAMALHDMLRNPAGHL